jgi:hypothetical protein
MPNIFTENQKPKTVFKIAAGRGRYLIAERSKT